MGGLAKSVGGFLGDVVGGLTGSTAAAEGAEKAAKIQAGQSTAGIAENRRQFDKLVELMSPYVTSGTKAIGGQQDILGLNGNQAQSAAISNIEQSPEMLAMIKQGEEAMLQNASATGGLRGGNLQGAMAQFRPQMLAEMIQRRFANLGGLTQIGQASAAGQASAGMQSAGDIGNLMAQRGAALAGGTMAGAGGQRQAFGDILSMVGVASGAAKAGLF